MNTYELCAQMLANGFIPANHPNFSLLTSAGPVQLLKELNGCMTQNFERPVVNARSGYWLRSTTVTVTQGRASYRVPDRAAAGGLERVEIARDATSEFVSLEEESGTDAPKWSGAPSTIGIPRRFELRGSQLTLLPAPDSSSYVLRFWFCVRPSQLVRPQSPTFTETSSVDSAVPLRGRINTVSNASGNKYVLVDSSKPYDMLKATPTEVSLFQRVDIIHPGGWYEPVLVDVAHSSGGSLRFNFADDVDLSLVEVGDYVRVADQTDWPCIPADFHRLLADLASMTVLVQLHLIEKARAFGEKSSGDMDRFRDLLQPRVQNQARSIPFPDHVLGGIASRGW